jgi:hypothetical protein
MKTIPGVAAVIYALCLASSAHAQSLHPATNYLHIAIRYPPATPNTTNGWIGGCLDVDYQLQRGASTNKLNPTTFEHVKDAIAALPATKKAKGIRIAINRWLRQPDTNACLGATWAVLEGTEVSAIRWAMNGTPPREQWIAWGIIE